AADRLSDKYRTNHPYAIRELRTDGTRIYDEVPRTGSHRVYEELGRYQFVIAEAAEPFFKQVEYQEDLARYLWPLGPGKVVLDPERGFGKPIDHASGVPTYVLYQMRLAGESRDRIARWYGVTEEAVQNAIDYEVDLAA